VRCGVEGQLEARSAPFPVPKYGIGFSSWYDEGSAKMLASAGREVVFRLDHVDRREAPSAEGEGGAAAWKSEKEVS
jgi:hypothetical protein